MQRIFTSGAQRVGSGAQAAVALAIAVAPLFLVEAATAVSRKPLVVKLTENPFRCDNQVRKMGVLSGARPGERITFTSPRLTGLLPGTADSAGTVKLQWQCSPADAGTSWTVTARTSSGATGSFTVIGGSATGPDENSDGSSNGSTSVAATTPKPKASSALKIVLTENPFRCDDAVRKLGVLSGARPGERVTFTSPGLTGLLPGTASPAGRVQLQWVCSASDVGTSWTVTARSGSGRTGVFTVVGT